MSRLYRNIKKRRLMDKVEHLVDSHSVMLNQRDYYLNDLFSEFHVNDAPWLVNQKPLKMGVFKKVKPRVK